MPKIVDLKKPKSPTRKLTNFQILRISFLFKKMKKLTENPNLRIQESKRNRKAIRTFTKEKYMQKLSSIVAKHTS